MEPHVEIRPPEEVTPAEELQPAPVESPNLPLDTAIKPKRGRPRGSTHKKKFFNFQKPKQIKSNEPIKPITPIEAPEQWTTCRLRQDKREIVRNRIAAIAKDTLAEEKSWKLRLIKERLERLQKIEARKLEEERRRNEIEQKRRLRLERARERRRNETDEQRFARLERARMAWLKRLETETEEDRSARLERHRRAAKRNYLKEIEFETEEQRYRRLERSRMSSLKRRVTETEQQRYRRLERSRMSSLKRRVTETEEQRYRRLERRRMWSLKRRVTETEEQRYRRLERSRMSHLKRLETEKEKETSLRLECEKRARQRHRLKILRAPERRMLVEQEDQKSDLGNYLEGGDSKVLPHQEDERSSPGTFIFEIGNFTPKDWFHQEFTMESPTQNSTIVHDVRIKEEREYDAICHLLHTICSKQHSHQPQQHHQIKLFDTLCSSRTSNYILSTAVWHKLTSKCRHSNEPVYNGIDVNESFFEPDTRENEIKAEWSDAN